jgi:hypothetical protein
MPKKRRGKTREQKAEVGTAGEIVQVRLKRLQKTGSSNNRNDLLGAGKAARQSPTYESLGQAAEKPKIRVSRAIKLKWSLTKKIC